MTDRPKPYLEQAETVVRKFWNPDYPQDAPCTCGHPYHRHFDTYEMMAIAGCKYCHCQEFVALGENADGEKSGLACGHCPTSRLTALYASWGDVAELKMDKRIEQRRHNVMVERRVKGMPAQSYDGGDSQDPNQLPGTGSCPQCEPPMRTAASGPAGKESPDTDTPT